MSSNLTVPTIFLVNHLRIFGEGEFVLGLFGTADRPGAFMIVNRNDQRAAKASVTIARPGHRLQELDRQTGQWTRGEELGGTRTPPRKLGPGDGRLFRTVE